MITASAIYTNITGWSGHLIHRTHTHTNTCMDLFSVASVVNVHQFKMRFTLLPSSPTVRLCIGTHILYTSNWLSRYYYHLKSIPCDWLASVLALEFQIYTYSANSCSQGQTQQGKEICQDFLERPFRAELVICRLSFQNVCLCVLAYSFCVSFFSPKSSHNLCMADWYKFHAMRGNKHAPNALQNLFHLQPYLAK